MAEQPFERELRTMLARDLDAIHGPHARWADAPVARRIELGSGMTRRWRTFAALAAATLAAVALVMVVASRPNALPAATPGPIASASIEPWPATVAPDAAATIGEVPLGRVAVVTQGGKPVLLVRVSPATSTGGGDVAVRVEFRVIAALQEPVGVDRLALVRNGRQEAPGLGVTGADPLAVAVAAPAGTEVSTVVSFAAGVNDNVDLGFMGVSTYIAFSYPLHRAPPPPSLNGRCPTLDDYAIASLQPSAAPVRPSFDPVSPDATPSTGLLPIGATGIMAAPDGKPGVLIRVTNARFCDRLPDVRPETQFGFSTSGGVLLLADVEIEVLTSGAMPLGFIPEQRPLVAVYGGRFEGMALLAFGIPGFNYTSDSDPGAGFTYRGTMGWEIPSGTGRVAIEVRRDALSLVPAQFAFLVRQGALISGPDTPMPTSASDLTPTTGTVRPGDAAILRAGGGTIPILVDGIAEVPRYPGLVPARPGDVFLELRLGFLPGSGTFPFDPAEWVIVGPDGTELPRLERSSNDVPAGWPQFVHRLAAGSIPPSSSGRFYVVVEAPASGRVTLEYRPAGVPALVTWVLRDK